MVWIIAVCAALFTAAASLPQPQHEHGGFMQGGMHHAVAKGVKLDQNIDQPTHTITLRIGPVTLPAHTDHMKMPQPPDLTWEIPFDGWLLGYTPRLVDAAGNEVPGRILHHVAFWNENRADFLCPNKEEHIFGAGSELTNWAVIPGYGYYVKKGDRIRIETMVYNPTATSYDKVFLEVRIPFVEVPLGAKTMPLPKNVYPMWMDVQSCRDSSYDLKPGENVTVGSVQLKYDGVLLGVGGHMHDYAQELLLQSSRHKEAVALLPAKVDEQGQLLSMPVVTFFETGGYALSAGDKLTVTATYNNTTGKLIRDGAMGIVVGYFVPADDTLMNALRRTPKPPSHHMAGMTHEH
jgi:hypothetical protein